MLRKQRTPRTCHRLSPTLVTHLRKIRYRVLSLLQLLHAIPAIRLQVCSDETLGRELRELLLQRCALE